MMSHGNATQKDNFLGFVSYTSPPIISALNVMKPATAKATEPSPLEDLGRATLEIVHDFKNQLNGLKLYATFLRKRLDREDRSADERETIAKLIAGLERAAAEIAVLVSYAHPIELKARTRVNLRNLLESFSRKLAGGGDASENKSVATDDTAPLYGNFDSEALAKAFRAVTEQVLNKARHPAGIRPTVDLHRANSKSPEALIEWHGVTPEYHSATLPSLDGKLTVRLALAARIIEAHGGRVEHAANIFRVWLPLSE